jgi:phage terminase large subunit
MNYDKLSNEQIKRYLSLLHEEEIYQRLESLKNPTPKVHGPNYIRLHDAIENQEWGFDDDGKPVLLNGVAGQILEGSSRSTKTWGGVDCIMWLCTDKHKDDGCTINIYRETYNEFKTTLYDDFKRRLDYYELDNVFHRSKEVKSFRIGKSTINFLGDGKHGGGCDYAFFNEAMMIRREVFDQVEMRCRKFWWMDYNPSFTRHWVFDNVQPRKDVGFLRTTFRDNNFISATELNKILGYEPWDSGSYEVTEEGQLLYQGVEIDEKNQPPPHKENVEQGTADTFMWKCYGLGLRGSQEGLIHKGVVWIDEFPNIAHTYCTDFGYVNDPCSVNKYAEDEDNIYIEPLIYQPISTPDEMDAAMVAVGVDSELPNAADSSDVYMSEIGKIEMVRSLRNMGWEIFKISKTKGNYHWINSMNDKKIHIVKNHLYEEVKPETENYIWKTVNGIPINQPIDAWNHFWDSSKYGHMSHSKFSQGAETS